jgi:hypothetical protein
LYQKDTIKKHGKYDVSLFLERKDEDNLAGKLIEVFSANAQRIKTE